MSTPRAVQGFSTPDMCVVWENDVESTTAALAQLDARLADLKRIRDLVAGVRERALSRRETPEERAARVGVVGRDEERAL